MSCSPWQKVSQKLNLVPPTQILLTHNVGGAETCPDYCLPSGFFVEESIKEDLRSDWFYSLCESCSDWRCFWGFLHLTCLNGQNFGRLQPSWVNVIQQKQQLVYLDSIWASYVNNWHICTHSYISNAQVSQGFWFDSKNADLTLWLVCPPNGRKFLMQCMRSVQMCIRDR